MGKRRPTLTAADLENYEPFENLKNIDKKLPKKSDLKHDDHAALGSTTRVSFSSAGRDAAAIKRLLPEPPKSLEPSQNNVKRATQEPLVPSVPEYTDIKPTTQETVVSPVFVHTASENKTFFLGKYITVLTTSHVFFSRENTTRDMRSMVYFIADKVPYKYKAMLVIDASSLYHEQKL